MKNITLTSLLFFLFFYAKAEQQSPTTILLKNPIDSLINITNQSLVFVDKTTKLQLEDIISEKYANQFIPSNELVLDEKFKRAKYRYWTHFIIKNTSDEIIHFRYKGNSTDSITLYIKDTLNNVQTLLSGRWTHGSEGKVSFPFSNRISIPVKIPANSQITCWVKKMNEYGYNNIVERLYHPDYEIKKFSDSYLTYTSFIRGFFLFLIFLTMFTMVQFIQNRDKAFLFYGLYVFFLFCFYLREVSYFDHVIHLIPIEFYKYKYYTFLGSAMFIFYLLFVGHFINAPIKYPKFYKLLKGMVGITFFFLVIHQILAFYEPNQSWKLMHITRSLNHILILVALGYLIRIKDRLVRFVFIGTSLLFLGSFLTYLESTFYNWFHDSWWDADQFFAFIGITTELCFFTIVLGYKQLLVQKEKSKIETELLYKEKEAAQLKSLDRLKTTFVTNITHEFRTPLTVIQGMAKELKGNFSSKKLIHSNSQKLLQLVNQLLDLSKIESGNMPMNLEQGNIIIFINYLVESLQSFAYSKKINLIFYSELEELKMDFDAQKMQSIIINLISNAIKFTPEYGKVMIVGKTKSIKDESIFILKISDTGKGIPEEVSPFIFHRYFQVESSNTQENQGTGIGLALVKELTELHHGKIEFNSEINKGSTFILSFPISNNAPIMEDLQTKIDEDLIPIEKDEILNLKNENSFSIDKNELPTLLVIEDNYDVVQYLTLILKEKYQILFAKNGVAGIEKALLEVPDIIISDVMMPEKDGLEVCATLKQDERTNHIPIILLTAKATPKDKLDGLQHGADVYLMKPFEKEELMVRLEKLLELRKKLQLRYSNFISHEKDIPLLSKEELFLQKLNKIILKNISDEEFSTPFLCKEMAMSNSQLYRKLKAITGSPIGKYIRNQRLQYAHNLLENSHGKIIETAYKSGFSNISWFNQAFKEKFGYPPSELHK